MAVFKKNKLNTIFRVSHLASFDAISLCSLMTLKKKKFHENFLALLQLPIPVTLG